MPAAQEARSAALKRWNAGDRGPFMGVPATGTPVALPGITILHFRGGRGVGRFSRTDMLGLLIQLGAGAPPATVGA